MIGACRENGRQCNAEENVKRKTTPKEGKEDLG
jgi:hypothetical protein